MPGNKRPRKPKHTRKRKPAETPGEADTDSNVENTQEIAKSYGSQKEAQSINSPGMTRGSARSR